MKHPRRSVLILLLLALGLLLAFLFRSFLLENLVRPVALVLWLIWRVLLSFNQRVVWSLLIFAALFYVSIRFSQHGLADSKPAPAPDSHLTLANIEYWRTFVSLTASEKARVNVLKQNLVEMLVSMYVPSQPKTPYWEVSEALRQRQIPLPENVYTFLFPPGPPAGRPTFQQVLQNLWRLPARWSRQWSGRAEAEYYRSIDEVLKFMETSLEIEHDHK
jgi:hypothetical protein